MRRDRVQWWPLVQLAVFGGTVSGVLLGLVYALGA